MTQYYEAHITIKPSDDTARVKRLVEQARWKFSAIDGDANLGGGVKMYATRQFNKRIGKTEALRILHATADNLQALDVQIIRRKIELVLFDDRSSKVGACDDCEACYKAAE